MKHYSGGLAFGPELLGVFSENFRRLYSAWKRGGSGHDRNQQTLANLIGCNAHSISNYMRGKNIPTKSRLQALADVLGCDASDLLQYGRICPLTKGRCEAKCKLYGSDGECGLIQKLTKTVAALSDSVMAMVDEFCNLHSDIWNMVHEHGIPDNMD